MLLKTSPCYQPLTKALCSSHKILTKIRECILTENHEHKNWQPIARTGRKLYSNGSGSGIRENPSKLWFAAHPSILLSEPKTTLEQLGRQFECPPCLPSYSDTGLFITQKTGLSSFMDQWEPFQVTRELSSQPPPLHIRCRQQHSEHRRTMNSFIS